MLTFEGRWGYYALSYEDSQRLKEAHGLLLRAYRDVKRHIRWTNKDPQNRRGPEPQAPTWFIEHGYHRLTERTFYGPGFRTYRDEQRVLQDYYLHVLRQYQQARRPAPTPQDVKPLDL